MDKRKVIYYTDEMNEEFSVTQITARHIGADYVYVHHSLFKKFTHFFWYRIVATPIAFLYVKLKFHHKVVGKKAFKACKKQGYFLFGNHTQDIGDAFMPNIMNFPRTCYMIVHPNNVSMPYLGRVTPSLGALPIPDEREAFRSFNQAVDYHIQKRHTVVVYPEAHIWPYYTQIRPFGDTSFSYPARLNAPVYCFTNTYQKRRLSKKPRIISYIDGPFFPDPNKPLRQRRRELREQVYQTMCQRAQNSNHIQIQYIRKEKDHD